VFIGAAVALGVGILFWTSVWLVLRSPSRTVTVVSADVAEATAPAADVAEATAPAMDVVDDLDESDTVAAVLDPDEDLDVPSHRTAVIPGVTDVVAVAQASEDREATEWDEVEGPAVETEVVAVAQAPVFGPAEPAAEDPLYGPFAVAIAVDAEGQPLYGPFEVAGPVDGADGAQATARTDATPDQAVARAGEVGVRVDEISARAEEMTARAEAFATKAEEFAARIEGLTARIDELETKLQASGSALTTRPAAVASPAPVVASRQSGQTTQTTVVRNSMALGANGRAPWVVAPQPEPGSRVAAGAVVLESRARGESPITAIRMQLDGAPVQVALDRRDETTWRGRASARVAAGSHTVAVTVVDSEGRTGSFRWQFVAQ
jgi:hypothetical protein